MWLTNDTRDKEIKGTIQKYLTVNQITRGKLLKYIGMKETTYYRRLENPSTFTLGEIRAIYDYLKVPTEERKF